MREATIDPTNTVPPPTDPTNTAGPTTAVPTTAVPLTSAPPTDNAHADGPEPQRTAPRGPWQRFTRWRRTRPFWGAIVLSLGAWFIMVPVIGGDLAILIEMGIGGISSWLIGLSMIAAAVTALLKPAHRHFPAIVASLMSVASLPLANLGGWLIGMILGIIGSGMVFAWEPYSDRQLARFAARDERRQARRAARRSGRAGARADR